MGSHPMPRQRQDGLIVELLGPETLVYDLERHRAHCLNPSAAAVWSACDGHSDLAEIGRRVALDLPGFSAEMTAVAIRELARARLLIKSGGSMPRRMALRKVSLAGALLPIVSSIVVPEAAQAASCSPAGGCCASKADCCPGLNCRGPQMPPCGPPPRDKRCG